MKQPDIPTKEEMSNLLEKVRAVFTEREQEVMRYMANHKADGSRIS